MGYRPPNANCKVFIKEYISLLSKLKKLKHHNIILGIDHNLDLLKTHLHNQMNQFPEENLALDLVPCVSKPTQITRKTATLIDNVIINQRLQINMHPRLIVEDISDHLPILIILKDLNKSIKGCSIIKSRNFCTNNLEKINNDIRNQDWQKLLCCSDACQSFSTFHKILCDTIDRHAPETTKRINPKRLIKNPWITSGIMRSLAKQQQMFKAHLKGDVSTYNY